MILQYLRFFHWIGTGNFFLLIAQVVMMKKRNICTFWDGAWDIQPPNSRKTLRFRHQEKQRRSKLEKIVAKIKALSSTQAIHYILCTCGLYVCVVLFFFLWGFRCLNITRSLQWLSGRSDSGFFWHIYRHITLTPKHATVATKHLLYSNQTSPKTATIDPTESKLTAPS